MRIEADLLISGRGDPVRDGVVLIDGARIAYAGSRAGAPRSDEVATKVRTVMPGLWDRHAHFLGVRNLRSRGKRAFTRTTSSTTLNLHKDG